MYTCLNNMLFLSVAESLYNEVLLFLVIDVSYVYSYILFLYVIVATLSTCNCMSSMYLLDVWAVFQLQFLTMLFNPYILCCTCARILKISIFFLKKRDDDCSLKVCCQDFCCFIVPFVCPCAHAI